MTNVKEDQFIEKLYDVIYKLSIISKTQSYRFKKEWDLIFTKFNPNPHLIRAINIEKDKFLKDNKYRIRVLNTVKLAFEDCFHSIKILLETLYNHFFNDSDLFKESFSEQDQLILKYFVAFKLLGDLVQYNTMDHKTVPLKYNILARNYLMIKLKGLKDTEIRDNMKKIRINLTITDIKKYLNQIEKDGFIKKHKKGKSNIYKILKELNLSDEGQEKYNLLLRPLIDWPTGIWRSFFNVRELNVTVSNNDGEKIEFLNNILETAATQGYIASHYVFKNLIKYYKEIKDKKNKK
ncbi:MAG: hypothetical protein ACTSV5_04610 [Promethearchaeota archaeon]